MAIIVVAVLHLEVQDLFLANSSDNVGKIVCSFMKIAEVFIIFDLKDSLDRLVNSSNRANSRLRLLTEGISTIMSTDLVSILLRLV